MINAELNYNPFIMETQIRFNGQPPRVNSLVEKYQKMNLQFWINRIPKIFHDEMNGYYFKLDFTGTQLDYDDLCNTFQKFGIKNDKVTIVQKGCLEDRITKQNRVNGLLKWLEEHPNPRFDYDDFKAKNSHLYEGGYSYVYLHGREVNGDVLSDMDVSVEYVDATDELNDTDLNYTPILIYITEMTLPLLASELSYFKARQDVSEQQLFFMIGGMLDHNTVGRVIRDLEEIYAQLVEVTSNLPTSVDIEKLKDILSSSKITNSRRNEQLMELLQINKKMPEAEMLKLICGLKGNLPKAFTDIVFDDDHQKYSVSFRDGNYDEKDAEMQTLLDEDSYKIVQLLKQMHDWGLLANIMRGEQYLSDARVKYYEKHAQDLKILKDLYKEYGRGQYNKMFRVMEDNNYSAYVGSVNSDKEKGKIRRGAKKDRDGFYKKLKSEMQAMQKKAPEDGRIRYILDEIDKESLLPKQLTSANGVIPYQVHLKELRKILSNAEQYLTFLGEMDESGLTNSEKILQLFSFQIPYYIGPLYNDGNASHNALFICKLVVL